MNRFEPPSLQTIIDLRKPTTYDWKVYNSISQMMYCDIMVGSSFYTLALIAYEIMFNTDKVAYNILDGVFIHDKNDNYKLYYDRYILVSHMMHVMEQFVKAGKTYSTSRQINGFTFGTSRVVKGQRIPQEPLNLLNRMYQDLSDYYYKSNAKVGIKVPSVYDISHNSNHFKLHLASRLNAHCLNDISTNNLNIKLI